MYPTVIASVIVLIILRLVLAFYLARQEVWKLQRANLVCSPSGLLNSETDADFPSPCQTSNSWPVTLAP